MILRKHKWVYVDNFRFKSQMKAFKILNKNAKISFFYRNTMICDMIVKYRICEISGREGNCQWGHEE